MKTHCTFEPTGETDAAGRAAYRCTRPGCGRVVYSATSNIFAACRALPGFGDTLARAAGWLGLKKKRGCGCERRQAALNRWFPYSAATWRARLRHASRLFFGLPRWLASLIR